MKAKSSCRGRRSCELRKRQGGQVKLHNIYRVYLGRREGQAVWLVDGGIVRRELYPDFVMGGNDQRYRFNPVGEIWIDNILGVRELEYTIEHELVERHLMCERGWIYERAHLEGGLAIEMKMRDRDEKRRLSKELQLRKMLTESKLPKDGIRTWLKAQERADISGIYQQLYARKAGIAVWIVNGAKVRHLLYPNLAYGTHDLENAFIPAREVWLDSDMSVEMAYYATIHQVKERTLIHQGMAEGNAYDVALDTHLDELRRQEILCRRHEAQLAPVQYGVRDRGVKM